jgi:hypothetical protein
MRTFAERKATCASHVAWPGAPGNASCGETVYTAYDALREQLYARSETAFRLRADALRTPATAVPRSGQSGTKPEESEGDRLTRQSDELRARFVRELDKVLTRRQKTAFNSMLGAPFDLDKVQFRGEQSRRSALPPADAPVILEPIAPPNTTERSKARD